MCGFLGSIGIDEVSEHSIKDANKYIECRGPDETVFKNLTDSRFNFKNTDYQHLQIFNRLSIIDLTNLGSQPMFSDEKSTSILFNGEIFNHKELRAEMESEGLVFKSNNSDTEVLLLGFSKYGKDFVNRVIGQFSIVFFDYKKNLIFLIRDRLGQKPLFYSFQDESLVFGSNLKSIVNLTNNRKINQNSVSEYLNIGVVTSPNTIFENIYKVKPAEIIELHISNIISKKSSEVYWNIEDFVDNKEFDESHFKDLLSDSVRLRNIADVPVACFLSGGIDSSTIVKLLTESGESVNTFSISYEDPKYDEKQWFEQVKEKYKTNHTTETVGKKIDIDHIMESIEIFDEPYSDPSNFPSYMISKKISEKYKAAISGDGGDELVGGYKRVNKILNRKKQFNFLRYFYNIYPNFLGTGNIFHRNSSDISEAYNSFFWDRKFLSILGIKDYKPSDYFQNISKDLYKSLLISDYKLYLSEMMTLKVDRTSMANSLEVRSPFIDHRLIEYILSTKPSYVDYGIPKKIFKEYLSEDFDSEFINREKMGFVFNLEEWIYSNKDKVFTELKNGNLSKIIKIEKINLLLLNKSRINANRIWKLYLLEKYLSLT